MEMLKTENLLVDYLKFTQLHVDPHANPENIKVTLLYDFCVCVCALEYSYKAILG